MGRVDTAWLRMDSDINRMVIVGVWVLRPGISRAALRQRLQERLLCYPRFTQRVVEDAAGAQWVPDDDFDIDRHLVTETLPRHAAGSAQRALQDRLGQLAMEPLDPRHPLWQFHLVEDYRGGSALLVRIHHCIADGIALISVMQSVTDGGTPPLVPPARTEHHAGLAWGAEEWLADTIIRPLTGLTVKAVAMAGDQAARSAGFWMHPQKGFEDSLQGSVDAAHLALQVASDMAALALMPDDTPTPLKGQPIGAKRVAWCPPLPLDDVKAVSKALCCSINDVLLACVAGALAAHLRRKGIDTHSTEIRAMVPVNLRPLAQAHQLGNHFGLIPVVLPLGLDNPLERVYEVRRRMQALKGSTQPLMSYGLLALAGLLVKPAQDALLGLFSRKTTAVMTNVPGPREKLHLCGSTIEESLFWVPQTGTVGLGVSILSYGGGVQFGVVADAGLCPDPQAIIDGFAPEFGQLTTLTLMLPWGESD
ncbi:wax ester/triacylglycerol synthase family O-acyltransferase [Curvibacter sp. APW13]|nr:wax ester/triacylglycerol synthase family O-acyltransferase [Curvibacter sp. APW13]MDT8989865.1 wax ester/triacylglycerol synthase family O-acyltransferase [Curvibacter sp. APW13]